MFQRLTLLRQVTPFVLVALLIPSAGSVQATDFTWTSTTSGNFTGNFSPTTPVSDPTTTLVFPGFLTQSSLAYQATNNLGSFTLNAIRFDSFTGGGLISTVSAGSTAGSTLMFAADGLVQPSILVNGTGMGRIVNGSATTGITIANGTTLTLGGSGLGGLQLAAVVGQATGGIGSVAVNHTGPFVLNAGSILDISGANTYSGGTTIIRGNVVVSNASALGSGAVTIAGSEHSVRSNVATLANDVILNQSLRLVSSTNNNFSGAFSGPGGLIIDRPANTATITMTGVHSATGSVVMTNEAFAPTTLTFSGASGTAAYSSYSLASHNQLRLDNTNGAAARITATAPNITLHRSTMSLIAAAALDATENFGTLTVSGFAQVDAIPGANSNSTLTFTSLSRQQNATLLIRGNNLGGIGTANTAHVVVAANPGGAVGGILPFAIATNSSDATSNFVRYDGPSGKMIALNSTTDYNPANLYVTNVANSGGQFRRSNSAASPDSGSVAGLVGPVTVNSFLLASTSVSGSATVNITSGALAITSSGTNSNAQTGLVNLGGVNFGSNTGYVHNLVSTVINSPLSGSAGLVVSGNGTLSLTAASSFTGGFALNGGAVRIISDAALGHPSNQIELNGGPSTNAGPAGLNFLPTPQFLPTPNTTLTINRPINIGIAGAGMSAIGNGVMNIDGPLSGSGSLFIGGSGFGTVALNGNNTNFNGKITVATSMAIASDAALGGPTASLAVETFGTLRVDGSFATSRNIRLGGTVLIPAGRDWQIDSAVASAGNLSLVGAGQLRLTATNLYNTFLAVGDFDPTARIEASQGLSVGPTLTLSGPNGALPLVGPPIRVSQSGLLHLDNSGPIGNANNNRLGNAGLLLRGGELKMTGNAHTDVTEFIGGSSGGLVSDGLLGTLTLVQPDSGGAQRQTTMIATAYSEGSNTPARKDIMFVRGTNFAAASGDRTALLLNVNPTTINGLTQAMVLATTANGAPTDFAATTMVGSQFKVVPFTAYSGQTPTSGGADANTYDNSALQAVTGNLNANALRLSSGGGLAIAPGATVTLASGMLLALPGNTGITGGTLTSTTSIFSGTIPLRVINVGDLSIGTATEPTAIITRNVFVKAGAGTLTLFGTADTNLGLVPNSGTRPTVSIAEGTLAMGNNLGLHNATVNGATGVLPDIVLGTPGAFDVSALSGAVRVRSFTGFGTVQIGNATVQTGDQSVSYGGQLIGSSSAHFIIGTPQSEIPGNTFGGQTQTLIGDNSAYQGGLTVLRGTLGINGSLASGSGTSPIVLGDTSGNGQAQLSLGNVLTTFHRDIVVQAGATPSTPHQIIGLNNVNVALSSNITLGQALQLNLGGTNAGAYFFTGVISGPGSLRHIGGNAVFSGANTFEGGFDLDAGPARLVGIGSSSMATTGPLGTGAIRLGTLGGQFLAVGGPQSLNNPVMTTGTTTNFSVAGSQPLTLTGSFDYSTLTAPLQLTSLNTQLTTFSGVISGTQPLRKNGPGTVVFASPAGNNYGGGTVVNAGTLVVTNSSGSATGIGPVLVNEGAILSGTGSISGTTTLAVGGIIRPGVDEVTSGTLTFANGMVAQDNSILSVTINGPSAGLISLTGGTFDLTSASSFSIYLTGSPALSATTYTIVDSGSVPIAFFGSNFDPSNFVLSANFDYGSLMLLNPTPTTLVLSIAPVPEPSFILLTCVIGAGATRSLFRMCRRQLTAR